MKATNFKAETMVGCCAVADAFKSHELLLYQVVGTNTFLFFHNKMIRSFSRSTHGNLVIVITIIGTHK